MNNEPYNTNGAELQPSNDSGSMTPPSAPYVPMKHKRKLPKKALVVILAIIVVCAAAAAFYFIKSPNKTTTASVAMNSLGQSGLESYRANNFQKFSDYFVPSYSDLRGYVKNGDETWVADFGGVWRINGSGWKYYMSYDGLAGSSRTSLVVHNGVVWIGNQGGISKYNSSNDTFTSYLTANDPNAMSPELDSKGALNTMLYVDPFDNKLLASTYMGLYSYDEKTNKWSNFGGADLPSDSELVFHKDVIVTTGPSVMGNPVRTYDRKTKTWSKLNTLGDLYTETYLPAILHATQIGGVPVVYGRHMRYESCESQGKYPASVFYAYLDGSWKPVEAANALFKDNEANFYASQDKTVDFFTSDCSGNNKSELYRLSYENGAFTTKSISKGSTSDYYAGTTTFDAVAARSAIKKATGLEDRYNIIGMVGNNYVVSVPPQLPMSNATYRLGLTQNFKNVTFMDTANKYSDDFKLATCGTKNYIIGSSMDRMNGYSTPKTVYYLDGTTLKSAYEFDNAASPIPDPGTSIPEHGLSATSFACTDGKISWFGSNKLFTLDLTEKKLSSTAASFGIKQSIADPVSSQTLGLSSDGGKVQVVGGKNPRTLTMPKADTSMLAVRNNSLWYQVYQDKGGAIVYRMDMTTGKNVAEYALDKSLVTSGLIDEDHLSVQVGDGIVYVLTGTDIKSSKKISKDLSKFDGSFPISSMFAGDLVVNSTDKLVWITTENYGLIGLKY